MVTSRVIDDLRHTFSRRETDEALAYFYFSRHDASRNSALAAVYSLLCQLSTSFAGDLLQKPLVELYERQVKLGLAVDRPARDDCERLLRLFVQDYPQTTLVIGALDECSADSRADFVKLLDELVADACRGPVKVFVSSRLDEDIRQRFAAGPNVGIRATENGADIARFVKAEIDRHPHWRKTLPDALQRSGGM
jgi:hypothetical protein